MRYSRYFLPTLREVPSEAQIVSHRLMLRCGMIHATALGIYSWLPFAVRVMQKIERIIDAEHERIGCHRLLMPTLQPASLWQESGRYDDYGKEMLRIRDRHERDLLYGPTHEEVVTDVARTFLKSYRDLPKVLYQISWKFRDEIRPRFGVMRGREFLMKDAYSFDVSLEAARATYEAMYNMYLIAFERMGLHAVPVSAASGAIGGDLSHEFHVVAQTGESEIFFDQAYEDWSISERTYKNLANIYIASDEKHDAANCPVPSERLRQTRGIEVGHIFYFGTKYSKSMNMAVAGPDGQPMYPEMGSYGIGVSRLVAAIIEANHDDNGIIWPVPVAPFMVGLIQAKSDDQLNALSENLYYKLTSARIETLWDDRDIRAGAKFNDMDLLGLPYQVIVGNQTATSGMVEVKNRKTGERQNLSMDECVNFITQTFAPYVQ